MTVLCYKDDHVSAMVVSGILGVFWALAAPVAVAWMGLLRQETHTDPRFKFLFGKPHLFSHSILFLFKRATEMAAAGGRL